MEPLSSDCKNLLKAIPNKWIEHIYCEANQCADALARMGLGASTPFVGFMELPPMVESLLAFDKVDMFCNKLINSYSMLIPNFNKKKKHKFNYKISCSLRLYNIAGDLTS